MLLVLLTNCDWVFSSLYLPFLFCSNEMWGFYLIIVERKSNAIIEYKDLLFNNIFKDLVVDRAQWRCAIHVVDLS